MDPSGPFSSLEIAATPRAGIVSLRSYFALYPAVRRKARKRLT
jgi:hypothetical protein